MKALLTLSILSMAFFHVSAQDAPAVTEVNLAVDPANPLKFDSAGFSVKAGSKVKLIFKNNATIPQPHNFVLAAPGALQEVTAAALAMAADTTAMEKGYIPESDKVLHHTKLLQVGEEETLEFDAPTEPGDYPFLCTFPGHAALMNGIMKVE